MFTGIVERLGTLIEVSPQLLRVSITDNPGDWVLGESVSVNGCCLTVVAFDPYLQFDLSPETWRRTAFNRLREGDIVNLERAMRPIDRFGGHIVQGHVDATGTLAGVTEVETGQVFRFQVPSDEDRYLIDKGSITIDGISLTVVGPHSGAFDVWVIPHTLSHTNLSTLKPGDAVNIEFDVIARQLERLLVAAIGRAADPSITLGEALEFPIQSLPGRD